jgi:hypothetical protein
MVPIPSQMNPIPTLLSYFFRNRSNIILPCTFRFPKLDGTPFQAVERSYILYFQIEIHNNEFCSPLLLFDRTRMDWFLCYIVSVPLALHSVHWDIHLTNYCNGIYICNILCSVRK